MSKKVDSKTVPCKLLSEDEVQESIVELRQCREQIARMRLLLEKAMSLNQEIDEPLGHMQASIDYLKSNLTPCNGLAALHVEILLGVATYISAAMDRLYTSLYKELLRDSINRPIFRIVDADREERKEAA